MSEQSQTETINTQAQEFTAQDIEKNKTMAALAYILFFLPMLTCPDSRFGRFHANQGLVLLIVSIIGSIVLSIIPIIGWILLPFFTITIAIFAILGIVRAIKGEAKKLPVVGKFTILK